MVKNGQMDIHIIWELPLQLLKKYGKLVKEMR